VSLAAIATKHWPVHGCPLVELVTQGSTYQEIADELGYASRGSVYAIVKKALKQHIAENIDDVRGFEVARLNKLRTRSGTRR
jgi:hypothetical protein